MQEKSEIVKTKDITVFVSSPPVKIATEVKKSHIKLDEIGEKEETMSEPSFIDTVSNFTNSPRQDVKIECEKKDSKPKRNQSAKENRVFY
jgi:hypothetical protein